MDKSFVVQDTYVIDSYTGTHRIRIVSYDRVTSIYHNEAWKHSIFHPDTLTKLCDYAFIASTGWSSDPAVTNVVAAELSKLSYGIYANLGNEAQSAISNIVSDRIIRLAPRSDGSVQISHFSGAMTNHKPTPYTISTNIIRRHRYSNQTTAATFSDGFIYHENVLVAYSSSMADEVGLMVKAINAGSIEDDT